MESKFGSVTLVLADNLDDMKQQNAASYEKVFFDPPFGEDITFLAPRINEAVRILKTSGNLTFLETPAMISEIDYYIKTQKRYNNKLSNGQSWTNIRQMEWITMQANIVKTLPDRLGSATRMFHIITKGYSTRKIYVNKNILPGSNIFNTNAEGLVTDIWIDKNFHAGRKMKIDGNFIGVHNSTTPKWAIEKLLSSFVRPGDKVYDCFGGSGRIPEVCFEYGIECRSVEINKDNYKIMCDVLDNLSKKRKRNKIFASYSVNLIKKAKESGNKNRQNNRLDTCSSRSINNSK